MLTGFVWMYQWDDYTQVLRTLHSLAFGGKKVAYSEYLALSLGDDEIARFDTSNFDPNTEYHDEWTMDEDRTVMYRRGAEAAQPWPVALRWEGCHCGICGSLNAPGVVLPEPRWE